MDRIAPIDLETLSTRTQTELETAAFIQRSFLQTKISAPDGFSVASFCRSAHAIGGDFFEVSQAGDGLWWLAIADVMGKGVPAALLATGLGPLLRSLKEHSAGPGELLAKLNRLLFPELSEVDTFITAQIVLADLRRRELRVAGAGHCPLLVVEPEAGTKLVKSTGLPLGVEPDGIFPEVRTRLDSKAGMLLYTDGVTEAQDENGRRFGQERLESLILLAVHHNLVADEIKDTLVTELDSFRGSAPVSDDQTFVVLTEASTLDVVLRPSDALCLAS
jgi:serine phosphatase RsbU (regulator of sigma subunit)